MAFTTASQEVISHSSAIYSTTAAAGRGTGSSVTITSVTITDSDFTTLPGEPLTDDLAVGTSNAYIKIAGSGFTSTSNVYVGNVLVPSANVTFTSSSELRIVLPQLDNGSNNIVAIFNNDNTGAIYTSRLLASAFPTIPISSYLELENAISLQLVGTGVAPLTFSLNPGDSLPAGLTLSSSGLISGTTDFEGISTFTVLIENAYAETSQQTLTLTTVFTDSNFNYVTALVQGDNVSNTATNGLFIDYSSKYLPIKTVSGYPTNGSKSPYYGSSNTSSYYLPGNGYYIYGDNSQISSVLSTTTTPFTLEFWVYPMATTNAIYSHGGGGGYSNAIQVGFGSDRKFYVVQGNGGGTNYQITSTGAYSLSQWHHIAVTKDSSRLLKLYVNGVLAASGTNTNGVAAAGRWVVNGLNDNNGLGNSGGHCFVSNIRFVANTTLYSTTFTPPTQPLTAVANTKVLLANNGKFQDVTGLSTNVLNTSTLISIEKFSPFSSIHEAQSYAASSNTFVGSTYLDGSNYLTGTNSNLPTGSQSYTIEAWIYPTSTGQREIFSFGTQNNGQFNSLRINSSTNGFDHYWWYNDLSTGNVGLTLNTWHHVVAQYNGTTRSIWLNGTMVASDTPSAPNTTGSTYIVGRASVGSSESFVGFISNLRVTRGQALYSSTFTPSTTPLTVGANTVMLTCTTTLRPYDVSNNSSAITLSSGVLGSARIPFNKPIDTSTANTVYSGSVYFYASGSDALSIPSTAFTGSPFTVEAWIYCTTAQGTIFSTAHNSTTLPLVFAPCSGSIADPNGQYIQLAYYNGSAWSGVRSTARFNLNQWTHVAGVFNGSNTKIYIDGVEGTSGTLATWQALNSNDIYIGRRWDGAGSNYFGGYIADARLSNTAIYTSNFTPSTTPLQPTANTTFLLQGKNTGIYDSKMESNLVCYGDARIRTDGYKYGTGCMYFDGTGDYLVSPDISVGGFGSGDFTVEYWFKCGTQGTSYSTQVGTLDNSGGNFSWRFGTYSSGANGVYFESHDGSNYFKTTFTSTNYNDNTWHHAALTRSGTTLRAFIDGTQVGSNVTQTIYLNSRRLVIGAELATPSYYTGFLDDLRITKGYARYTANFTAPTRQHKNK